METWATFSIVDHRSHMYRQALALFDKIVVPVPPQPIGDQTPDELTRLCSDIDYLARNGAAVLHEWRSDSFFDWRQPLLAEAIASGVNRDPFQDTRLMLAEQFHSDDIQAVPVYGSQELYVKSRAQLMLRHVEEALTFELLQRLPIPDSDTPLENLVRLRQDPAFRTALENLLDWKRLQAPAIFLAESRPSAMAKALADFDKLTRAYASAMESAGYKKAGSVASIFFAFVTGSALGGIKEGLVAFRELREPCWQKVSQMKCAPGGVVYHFTEALA